MKVHKTLAFFSDHDQGRPYLIDTIRYAGQWWLVGTWLEAPSTRAPVPEWLVLLDPLPHQRAHDQPYRFVLTHSIPKVVLDGAPHDGFVTLRHPASANIRDGKSIPARKRH